MKRAVWDRECRGKCVRGFSGLEVDFSGLTGWVVKKPAHTVSAHVCCMYVCGKMSVYIFWGDGICVSE